MLIICFCCLLQSGRLPTLGKDSRLRRRPGLRQSGALMYDDDGDDDNVDADTDPDLLLVVLT